MLFFILGEIQNVTIKMAKNQNLSLNPTTISGLCGKLLCCISYEDSQYDEINQANKQEVKIENNTQEDEEEIVSLEV